MSCLFDSLSHFIPSRTASQIRTDVCDYLSANAPILDGIDTSAILEIEAGTADDYVSKMRQSHEWGGGIEIQAACNLWAINVVVQVRRRGERSDISFAPVDGAARRTITIAWSGSHYTPVA